MITIACEVCKALIYEVDCYIYDVAEYHTEAVCVACYDKKEERTVIACSDLTLPEHTHYTHDEGTIYNCPRGCEVKWDNVCQIICHLEDHLK